MTRSPSCLALAILSVWTLNWFLLGFIIFVQNHCHNFKWGHITQPIFNKIMTLDVDFPPFLNKQQVFQLNTWGLFFATNFKGSEGTPFRPPVLEYGCSANQMSATNSSCQPMPTSHTSPSIGMKIIKHPLAKNYFQGTADETKAIRSK